MMGDEQEEVLNEDYVYQLRKIGPEASSPKIPEIMRLKLGLTRIGRGQHNDYFLDSLILKNFISRSHVEIFGKKNENGEVEFTLNDKGLNGTFINDIRTNKTCTMDLGDKITFGHTNGYKIEPGCYAEQPNSEFQYKFEKIPKSSKTSEMFHNDLTSDTVNREESTEAQVDQKKDSTTNNDRLFLSDIQSNAQVIEKTPVTKTKTKRGSRNRKDSSSQSDSEVVDSKNSSFTHTNTRGSKTIGKGNSTSPISSLEKESKTSKRKVSAGSASMCSETLPAVEDNKESSAEEMSEEETKVKEEQEEEKEESEEEKESEEETLKKKVPTRRRRGGMTQRKTAPQRKKSEPVPEPSDSDSSSDNDDSSKPEVDQKQPSQSSTSSKQKPVQKKRKPQGNNAPAVGSRRKRRRGGGAGGGGGRPSNATNDDGDDLEPGVEWYEDETCESADCKRPKKKRTSWVQCDDCDGWYHTVCVGANYNVLKDSNADFNCGCIPE